MTNTIYVIQSLSKKSTLTLKKDHVVFAVIDPDPEQSYWDADLDGGVEAAHFLVVEVAADDGAGGGANSLTQLEVMTDLQ